MSDLKIEWWPIDRPKPYAKNARGTGTTMVASQQLRRRCYGLEIEPKYCAVILERMSEMGLTPKLAACTIAADGRAPD